MQLLPALSRLVVGQRPCQETGVWALAVRYDAQDFWDAIRERMYCRDPRDRCRLRRVCRLVRNGIGDERCGLRRHVLLKLSPSHKWIEAGGYHESAEKRRERKERGWTGVFNEWMPRFVYLGFDDQGPPSHQGEGATEDADIDDSAALCVQEVNVFARTTTELNALLKAAERLMQKFRHVWSVSLLYDDETRPPDYHSEYNGLSIEGELSVPPGLFASAKTLYFSEVRIAADAVPNLLLGFGKLRKLTFSLPIDLDAASMEAFGERTLPGGDLSGLKDLSFESMNEPDFANEFRGNCIAEMIPLRIADDRLKLLPELRSLSITDCKMSAEGLNRLGERLIALSNLTHLELEGNSIGPDGMLQLTHMLEGSAITALRLGRNPLGDNGISSLAGSSILGRLKVLDLAETNMTHVGLGSLLSSIRINGGRFNLETLNLNYNDDIGLEGMRLLEQAIRDRKLDGLHQLQLYRCGLGCEGLEALAQLLLLPDRYLPDLRKLFVEETSSIREACTLRGASL